MTNITGSEVYKRTSTYERDSKTIRLHAPQWKLLLAFDGQKPVSEIASGAGTSLADAIRDTDKFLDKEWIAEEPISLEEYLRRASARGNYSGGVIPPSVVINESKSDPKPDQKAETKTTPLSSPTPTTPPPLNPPSMSAAPATPPPLTPANISSSASLPVSGPSATVPMPGIAASRESNPQSSSARGPMRLSAVVDYIVSMAETVPLGQLLAYRVFLRVPPEVLQSEDIVSVHLIDDPSVVKGEKLQKAIASAVQEIVKRALPDSVYATA